MIQGWLDTFRRNYSGLLQDVSAAPKLLEESRFELQLFTWGTELDAAIVPALARGKIVYKHLRYTVSKATCPTIAGRYETLTCHHPDHLLTLHKCRSSTIKYTRHWD